MNDECIPIFCPWFTYEFSLAAILPYNIIAPLIDISLTEFKQL